MYAFYDVGGMRHPCGPRVLLSEDESQARVGLPLLLMSMQCMHEPPSCEVPTKHLPAMTKFECRVATMHVLQ